MEPELGLGTITGVEHRRVRVNFDGSDCERQYAKDSAPLKRVLFKPGDKIEARRDVTFCIESVKEIEGLIIYCGEGLEIHEYDLSNTISFSTPKDRLLNGLTDPNALFNLRCNALNFRAQSRKSAVRGFTGGRIDLIGHQFYIAGEVSSRYLPRVLLSDEVGLGKTIEACLILHRLLLCERISRVLILVPDSLVHQWFVELLRRFNLLFRIFDDEFCAASRESDAETNPFLQAQLGICSIDFFQNRKRQEEALDAGWDMVIVDEAHHLVENSPEYLFAKELGQAAKGLMLLTATPEQLGERSHFAHLRLLDPARYYDFDAFSKNAKTFHTAAGIIDKIAQDQTLDKNELKTAIDFLSDGSHESREHFTGLLSQGNPDRLIEEIIDRHGTGRVIFRNTRAAITGFPRRMENLHPLGGTQQDIKHGNLELLADLNGHPASGCDCTHDPRIAFIVKMLQELDGEKVLLICRSVEKSIAIEAAVQKQVNARIALFNEQMSLIQRDRNAAWFSEKNGAQVLICSEIGSEGRNFQFAHHLIMFDIPLNPELLEQRIGRLDRIGQTRDIQIHIPYIEGTAWEILIKWHSKGLGLFKNSINGLHHLYKEFGDRVSHLALSQINGESVKETHVDELLKETVTYRNQLAEQFEQGRDRLLELNSFRPSAAKKLTDEIQAIDESREIDTLMLKIFDLYGIQTDETGHRSWRLTFDDLAGSGFPMPALGKNPLEITFDRKTALSREEIDFLSRDNPMVTGSLELLLGTAQGNSALAVYNDSGSRGALLEAVFVPECVAPAHLQIDRFLPASPIRIVIDHSEKEVTGDWPFTRLENHLENLPASWLSQNPMISAEILPGLTDAIGNTAKNRIPGIIKSAISEMNAVMEKEIHRLRELKKINPGIRSDEIKLMESEMNALHDHLLTTRLRLDAIRFILLN